MRCVRQQFNATAATLAVNRHLQVAVSRQRQQQPSRARRRRTFAAMPFVACDSTTSVNSPAPVRSWVSRTLLLLYSVCAPRATRSHSSRSAGWPGAAAKNQGSSWRRRAIRRRDADTASSASASQPATSVSSGEITPSSGWRHSASMSAYAPPMRSTTIYLGGGAARGGINRQQSAACRCCWRGCRSGAAALQALERAASRRCERPLLPVVILRRPQQKHHTPGARPAHLKKSARSTSFGSAR